MYRDPQKRAARRTAWLTSQGFRVLRFRKQALDEDIWRAVEEIQGALGECDLEKKQTPLPNPPHEMGGSQTIEGTK